MEFIRAGETCLALPKLNLQFLTAHDYLLRNFSLFRLEATYEIREDIADVLSRVGAIWYVAPILYSLTLILWNRHASCRLLAVYDEYACGRLGMPVVAGHSPNSRPRTADTARIGWYLRAGMAMEHYCFLILCASTVMMHGMLRFQICVNWSETASCSHPAPAESSYTESGWAAGMTMGRRSGWCFGGGHAWRCRWPPSTLWRCASRALARTSPPPSLPTSPWTPHVRPPTPPSCLTISKALHFAQVLFLLAETARQHQLELVRLRASYKSAAA